MLVLTDRCSTILDIKDSDVVIRLLRKHFTAKDSTRIFTLFHERSNFIFFQYSDLYDTGNVFEISSKNKSGILKKLEKYEDDFYYLLDIGYGSGNDYCYEIVHHSQVQVHGQASGFLRSKLIEDILKTL